MILGAQAADRLFWANRSRKPTTLLGMLGLPGWSAAMIAWLRRLWLSLRDRVLSPTQLFGPDNQAADERAAAEDAPTAEPDADPPAGG
jgi:hypothetical protein